MTVDYLSHVPPEIWFQIFDSAISSSRGPLASGYAPFQAQTILQTVAAQGGSSESLCTASNLTLVCQHWRDLAIQLFFKEILVLRGVCGLQSALKKDCPGIGRHGDSVKRIALPWQCTAGPPSEIAPSVDILRLCPKVEILSRPYVYSKPRYGYGPSFDYEAEAVALPSLSRLEWWYSSDAERAGGVNSLVSILQGTPNLRYLFVGGMPGTPYIYLDRTPVILPNLETLRLSTVSPLLVRLITTGWSLPSITKIILDSPLPGPSSMGLFQSFGSNLRTLELGRHDFITADCILSCLENCPSLEELNYYTFFTTPPALNMLQGPYYPHPNLATVGLHAATNPRINYSQEDTWELLGGHFAFLASEAVATVKHVVLYGDWDGLLRDPRFDSLKEPLVEACRTIELF